MSAIRARAMRIPAAGAALEPVDLLIEPPGPGEVVVRIEAVGVCGSDLFLQAGGFGPESLPRVPGHEASGVVHAVGPEVGDLATGDQVALYYIENSPTAPRQNLGPDVVRMGVDVDGAFAEYVRRPAATLIKPAAHVPPADLAVLTDAVATPYHALTQVANLTAGESLAVLGIGGIGSNAVQIGRLIGAHTVAITRSVEKRDLAMHLGADEVLTLAEARDRYSGSFDVVLQCAANAAMDAAAVDLGGYAGRVVLVATTPDSFSLKASALVWRELEVKGSRGFTIGDIESVVDHYLAGRLEVAHLIRHQRPLVEANKAFADLRSGSCLRSVLLP